MRTRKDKYKNIFTACEAADNSDEEEVCGHIIYAGWKAYFTHIMVVRENLLADHLRRDALLKCNLYLVNGKPHTMTHIGEVLQ